MSRFSRVLLGCALCIVAGSLPESVAQKRSTTAKHAARDTSAQELNQLLDAAQQAIDRQDYASAAQNYQDYLTKNPDDATVHYDLGYAYTALQKPADAKSEYEKAIALNPKLGPAYQNLGLTLLPTDPAGALAALQKAAELLPDDARTKWLLGRALEDNRKFAPAIDQFEAAKNLDAKDPDIRISLGEALLRLGRDKEAFAAFQDALTLQPKGHALAAAHLGLGRAAIAQKQLDEGVSELAAYLQMEPGDASVRIDRASALVDLGKDDEALAELDRAAAPGQEQLRALTLRSQIYWEKKRYDDALPVLQKAVALAPRDPDLLARLGRVYLQKKNYPNAVRYLAAAYNLNPNANDLLGDAIEAEYLNKNYTEALAALDALAKREELPLGSWFMRAACYDNLGETVDALNAYQRFLQLNKDENSDMYFIATARSRVLARELQNKKEKKKR
ncbi:MAG TPA: tetratricopeptide repeat protein [Verrucomicrobiae bacterium]|nr:tetratricopeptide repeat protein [Verrucomicrobiae bacterium]